MLRKGLSRFFALPIIPAPKWNFRLHKEMWTKSHFLRGWLGAGSARATHDLIATSVAVRALRTTRKGVRAFANNGSRTTES